MYSLRVPYLHFLGDAPDTLAAKTALGVHHWCPENSVGQFRLPGCKADLGIKDLSIEEAFDSGARTLLIGVANRGGKISEEWLPTLIRAMQVGMDIASGLHQRLDNIAALKDASVKYGVSLLSVRQPPNDLVVGTGDKRPGKRLLTVGTDCSSGKMYTALALYRAMTDSGMNASFRATGQTGIFIAGAGIAIDAVPSDFISGAVEEISPRNDADHWDLIEGQGSLFHPSFAGVSLGLLHGAQADVLIMCHEPNRKHMRGLPNYALPDIKACIEMNEATAKLTNPDVKTVGISLNTSSMTIDEAKTYCASLSGSLNLPVTDPIRFGVRLLLENLK